MQFLPKIIGVALIFVSSGIVVWTSQVSAEIFINLAGISLVVLGTLSSVFISYNFSDLKKVTHLMTEVFLRKETPMRETAQGLFAFCRTHRADEVDGTTPQQVHPFLSDALGLISDNYSPGEIVSILNQRVSTFYEKEIQDVQMLKVISKYPPAFGMIGTVTGLIALMSKIGGSSDMSQTGYSMAIALTTTLYGLVLSNFVLKPIADNIEKRAEDNFLRRRMILKVVPLFQQNASIILIQDLINSFLQAKDFIEIQDVGGKNAA